VPAQHETAGRPLRVLQSVRGPRPTTNPYVVQLVRGLREHADVRGFSWPAALLWRYDVLHLHWPEVVVERRHPLRRLAAVLALHAVLLRCRLRRTAVVRTAHNVRPHEAPDPLTDGVLRACDRATTWWVRLNDTTPVPPDAPATTVPHGDYTAWFAGHPPARPVPGRLVTVGLLRPYKGVDELLAAFGALDDPAASLVVAGRPVDATLAAQVRATAADDPRVVTDLRHVDDADLVRWTTSATLVVLPYRRMHNSGAALLALSLRRPVLVPGNPVTDALAAEVGPAWVQRFTGPLTADVLRAALAAAADLPARDGPDLRARDWTSGTATHLEVYRAAVARARGAVVVAPSRVTGAVR
jgi:beta-1,4-mannosyltransferase